MSEFLPTHTCSYMCVYVREGEGGNVCVLMCACVAEVEYVGMLLH